MTPLTVAGIKHHRFSPVTDINVYVGKQVKVPAYGKGVAGSNIKTYVQQMEEISIKTLKEMWKANNFKPYHFGSYVYFDEDKTEWS